MGLTRSSSLENANIVNPHRECILDFRNTDETVKVGRV